MSSSSRSRATGSVPNNYSLRIEMEPAESKTARRAKCRAARPSPAAPSASAAAQPAASVPMKEYVLVSQPESNAPRLRSCRKRCLFRRLGHAGGAVVLHIRHVDDFLVNGPPIIRIRLERVVGLVENVAST